MEPIKRFLTAIFLVFGFALHAANPAYESFKGTNGVVLTTPGIGAARVVVVSGELFQPGSTNLTNWANLPTNVVSGASIWTQSGGTAFPTSAGTVIATNAIFWDRLTAKGAFIAETRSRTLSLGTNVLSVSTNAFLLLDSPTNDAAQVVIELGPAVSSGADLVVMNNQTNKAFVLYDGSVSGSGFVRLQGNFISTNMSGALHLRSQGASWVEVSRSFPNEISQDQIWANDNGTVYIVPTNVFEVFTTNLNNEGVLYSLGPITLGSTSQILSLGTNDVNTSLQSDRVMTSPTNNAALVKLRLTPPTFGAQILFISNGDTNTSWTFVDGQTNTTGGGAANLQGDFVANAPGVGLLLKADGNDWVEIGRFNPGGLAPAAINPTDGVIPVRGSATTFTNSPLTVIDARTIAISTATNYLFVSPSLPILVYSNASDNIGIQVHNPLGRAELGVTSGGHAMIQATAPSNDKIVLIAPRNTSGNATYSFDTNEFYTAASNSVNIGRADRPFKSLYLGTNSYFLGTNVYTDNGANLLRNGVAVGASSGPTFADMVWTNDVGVIRISNGQVSTNQFVFLVGKAYDPTNIAEILDTTTYWPLASSGNPQPLLFAARNAGTNRFMISPSGSIGVGVNALEYFGDLGAAENTAVFSHDISNGELASQRLLIESRDSPAYLFYANTMITSTANKDNPIVEYRGETQSTNGTLNYFTLGSTLTGPSLSLLPSSIQRTLLHPGASATDTAYIFNTSVGHTSGSLVTVSNLNVGHFTVAATNGIATPAITAYGAVSKAWQFGAATNTVDVLLGATNVVEITVAGVAYLIPAKLK